MGKHSCTPPWVFAVGTRGQLPWLPGTVPVPTAAPSTLPLPTMMTLLPFSPLPAPPPGIPQTLSPLATPGKPQGCLQNLYLLWPLPRAMF